MNLTVTQEDIDKASPCNAWLCAVALAFQREHRDSSISVGASTAGPHNDLDRWELTEEMQEYIMRFDGNEPVYPITFLNIPLQEDALWEAAL